MIRILLIEAERIICLPLKPLLGRNDYDVVDAESVDEAELIQRETFDAILANRRLPGRNGTYIFKYCEKVPVLMKELVKFTQCNLHFRISIGKLIGFNLEACACSTPNRSRTACCRSNLNSLFKISEYGY